MAYYPQVNSNYILTQLPYKTSLAYDTVSVDMETGMRFSFARRGSSLPGFPIGPLSEFNINYPSITDSEVAQVKEFFDSQRGSWGVFSVLDPAGNLVPYSEDFSQWTQFLSTVNSATTDPFGHSLATTLTATGDNANVSAVIGDAVGGMSGTMVCVSIWARATFPSQSLFVGMRDADTLEVRGTTFTISNAYWRRISFSDLLWNDGSFSMVVGGAGSWNTGFSIDLFGAQASPAKGEAAYGRTPGNYGLHKNCRFGTDVLVVQALGPNQNSLALLCAELGGA